MKRKNSEGSFEYGIHEVFYNERGEVSSWTEEALTPVCSSSDDLKYELKIMMKAFDKETLEFIDET